MTVAPFTVEVILVAFVTLYVLHQFGNLKKQHYIVTGAVFISWFFSFLIIFVLPLDVSSTFYHQCVAGQPKQSDNSSVTSNNEQTNSSNLPCKKPWTYMSDDVLLNLWRVVYWSSQILSWIVLPMMQSYTYAGDFTIQGKIKTALYENALWYASYLVIFVGLMLYVIFHPGSHLDGNKLKMIGIAASNTWGLILLVILMGYGLVEVPRTIWHFSNLEYQLAHTYFKVSKMSTEKEEAEEKLNEVLTDVRKASESIRYNHRFRKHINVIINKCPERDQQTFNRGTDDYVDYDQRRRNDDRREVYEKKDLVKLHKQVIAQTLITKKARCQWNRVIENAFYLEDLERNTKNRERVYVSAIDKTNVLIRLPPSMEWHWKIWMKPWLWRVSAVILAVLSIALIWSEVTFFIVKPRLSLFALLLYKAQEGYYYFYVELVSWVTITYMCICTYYTVFRIRVFNFYYFAPHHQTDPNSLLFSGLILCRLTYALCLNFLSVIHLDNHVVDVLSLEDTAFTRVIGHLDVLNFVANGFNIYYPMSIVLVCLATYFSLGSRCLNCLGFQAFVVEDDVSVDYVAEGKELVRREKRERDVSINPGDTRQRWKSRGRELKEKLNRSRGESSNDVNVDHTPTVSGSSSRLVSDRKIARYLKPSRDEGDRVELLSDVDDPYTSSPYSTSRFERSVPKNVFDGI